MRKKKKVTFKKSEAPESVLLDRKENIIPQMSCPEFDKVIVGIANNKIIEGDLTGIIRNVGQVKALAEAITKTKSLKDLILWDNNISKDGMEILLPALKLNSSIEILSFGNNALGDDGARLISDFLRSNAVLKSLSLIYNNIGAEGACYLTEALSNNTALEVLSLSGNALGDKGAICLAEVIKNNRTLKYLNLTNTNILVEGVKAIAEAQENNYRIEVCLKYSNDEFTNDNNLIKIPVEGKPFFDLIKSYNTRNKTYDDYCSSDEEDINYFPHKVVQAMNPEVIGSVDFSLLTLEE
ncbi:MAG: hypothetical protein K0Q51_178 [Rickettsiaceae bacterium]|jgi:Ran GTPase-activating protein (RanGAP) involved in mRNA processing and transport|nr:hypothetical protein [Rickettsiaceae bacterium]